MPAVKTRTVPALYKALSILELLTRSRTGLTMSGLVEQSGLAKSSVHYLLVTLERCGYVRHSQHTGRYVLGIKLFSMANSALGSLSIHQRTTPYLFGLRMRTGLTVHLAILERDEAVLIGKLETTGGAHLASWIGKRMDFHCTAIGKAILAFLPEREAIILNRGLARHNENTVSTLQHLQEDLERVVKNGYALDNEEDELGVRCIGVPIFSPTGRPLAAISLAGSTSEISLKDIPQLSRELRRTATATENAVVESITSVLPHGSIDSIASNSLSL